MPTERDARTLSREVERLRTNSASHRRPERAFALGARWNERHGGVDFLYRDHQLICLDHDVTAVLDAFRNAGEPEPREIRGGPVGVSILDIGERDAADLAEKIAEVVGDDDLVTPNHVLDAQAWLAMCPASEPKPWYGPAETLGEPVGQGKARIAVVDTGFSPEVARASKFDRFSAVSYDHEIDDEVYYPDSDKIRPYGGHGTAATAQLLAISGADSVTVRVADCLVGGAVDEITIVEDLERIVNSGVDIISIQAGLYTRTGTSPKAFNAFRRQVLSKHPDVVIVAAAGNN